MNPIILPLSDPRADLQTVGGKGASLARLIQSGLPVPSGFHVTTEAYRQFVADNRLQPGIAAALQSIDLAQPSSLEVASRQIRQRFEAAAIPVDLERAIAAAYEALAASDAQAAVAVRSSATAEDLPEASFAGQQETFLNVRGVDQVLKAVKDCWASLWTARAIGYRARQAVPTEGVALAVVVQLLVKAEAAGILFTINPINGKSDEMVINAAWGLGEAVVGGAVTPDTIVVSKPDFKIIRRETAEKQVMTSLTESGTAELPVDESMKTAPALPDEQAAELARFGWQIEKIYGGPMDVEWALAGGEFTILQARPVTASAKTPIQWVMPDPKGVYMRSSVVDLMPNPLSPLFVSWGIPTLKKQMQPLGTKLTGSKPALAEDYFTSINNFAYMNARMPAKAFWWILTGLMPAMARLIRKMAALWKEEFHPQYRAFAAGLDDIHPAAMSAQQLWETSQTILDQVAYYVTGLLFATLGSSAGSEMALTKAYNSYVKREGDPEAAVLMMGWNNIPIRAEKSLYDLAMWVKGQGSLAKFLLETPTAKLAEQIPPYPVSRHDAVDLNLQPVDGWAEFVTRFHSHLKEYGYIIFQLDFAEPLPLERPEAMLENVKMYLRGEGSNPHERQLANEQKRIRTTESALARVRGLKGWAFRNALKWGQSMSEIREDALAEIGLGYPMLRRLLLELGSRLAAQGVILQAEDIFLLQRDEIQTLVSGQRLMLIEQTKERAAFLAQMKKETPPPMIPVKDRVWGVKTEAFVAQSADERAGNVLRGNPTSAGKVTAPACILLGPEDFDQMRPGCVLVAGTTTPAWTPLFAMAAAVVTDIGGPLSHGSIVAREYGIPAVMGTGGATRRIRNGQMLVVDGSVGTVTLLES